MLKAEAGYPIAHTSNAVLLAGGGFPGGSVCWYLWNDTWNWSSHTHTLIAVCHNDLIISWACIRLPQTRPISFPVTARNFNS